MLHSTFTTTGALLEARVLCQCNRLLATTPLKMMVLATIHTAFMAALLKLSCHASQHSSNSLHSFSE